MTSQYTRNLDLKENSSGNEKEANFDRRLSNFIVAYFFMQALNLLVKIVLGDFSLWSIISKGILVVLLMICLMPIIKRQLAGALVSELLLVASLTFTVLTGGANFNDYGSIMLNAITVFMPMGIVVNCIRDKSILLNRLYYGSWPTQIVLIIVLLNLSGSEYSMPGGYALAFQLLIVMDHFFANKKWYDLIAIAIDFFIILVFGSRGPILCIMSIIVIRLVFSHNIKRAKKIILISLIVIFAVCAFIYYKEILAVLISLSEKLGYSSRNLRYIAMKRITDDSGRGSIHRMYFDIIKKNPLIGYGLVGGWVSPNLYPHHIFIEFLLSFGLFFGCLASIIVLVIVVRSAITSEENEQRLAHILISYCTSLLLSDSFMMCPMFFMLMGLGLNQSTVKLTIGHTK